MADPAPDSGALSPDDGGEPQPTPSTAPSKAGGIRPIPPSSLPGVLPEIDFAGQEELQAREQRLRENRVRDSTTLAERLHAAGDGDKDKKKASKPAEAEDEFELFGEKFPSQQAAEAAWKTARGRERKVHEAVESNRGLLALVEKQQAEIDAFKKGGPAAPAAGDKPKDDGVPKAFIETLSKDEWDFFRELWRDPERGEDQAIAFLIDRFDQALSQRFDQLQGTFKDQLAQKVQPFEQQQMVAQHVRDSQEFLFSQAMIPAADDPQHPAYPALWVDQPEIVEQIEGYRTALGAENPTFAFSDEGFRAAYAWWAAENPERAKWCEKVVREAAAPANGNGKPAASGSDEPSSARDLLRNAQALAGSVRSETISSGTGTPRTAGRPSRDADLAHAIVHAKNINDDLGFGE